MSVKFKKGLSFPGITIILLAIFIFLSFGSQRVQYSKTPFYELKKNIEQKNVDKIKVNRDGTSILAVLKDGTSILTNNPGTEQSNNLIYNSGVVVEQSKIDNNSKNFLDYVLMITIGSIIFMIFKSAMVNTSTKSLFDEGLNIELKNSDITFEDIAGNEESKEAMQDLAFYLKNPNEYAKYGINPPKGAILFGPPGTGKTLLAKALANECNCAFISVTGSNFVEKFVGSGAARVRRLFEDAKANKPCIIFIDEIDAVGGKRNTINSHEERNQTLNELLAAMDGFSNDSGVIVIGATNRLDSLDDALLRSGRFDTKIYIGLPDIEARKNIFKVHFKNKPISKDVDVNSLAKITPGFSGADISNVMNKAGFYAAKNKCEFITIEHINKAISNLVVGDEKKNRVGISGKDKKITAYHEAGHAIVARKFAGVNVTKISIIPTTHGAGGYTLIDNDETSYKSKRELLNQVAILLGGRAAEDIILGEDNVTTGASADIVNVTRLLEGMIKKYGMSSQFGLLNLENSSNLEKIILHESKEVIEKIYEDTKNFLSDNIQLLHTVANTLIEKEIILEDDFENIIKENRLIDSLKKNSTMNLSGLDELNEK